MTWAALAILSAVIFLWFGLAMLSGLLGEDAAAGVFYGGMLIALPAMALWLPVLTVAVIVDLAGRWAFPGKPIAVSWDVLLDGEAHVVSLPATRMAAPGHAWVDGTRVPVAWTSTGATTAQASLDAGAFIGTLLLGYAPAEVAASAVVLGVSAALGAGTAGAPAARYGLQVDGAAIEPVPVTDGERRS